MSITRKIAHNTVIQISGKIASVLLGLAAIGMMTRYLGQEQFGWYITTITFLQFVGILIDFGLVPVTAQMLSEPEHDEKTLLQNLLGFRFISAIIFLGIAPMIAMFFPYPVQVKVAISFSAIAFLAVAMNQVLIGFYQTKLKMHLPTIGEIVGRIILVVGLWLLIKQQSSFLSIMIVVSLSSIVYTAVIWLAAIKHTVPSLKFDWEIWKKIIKKMWPIAISIIFNVVYLKGDTVLLSLFRTQIEVGIYGAAYRVIDILAQTAMMLMGVMLPLLAFHWARQQKLEFEKHFQQAFDSMMLLAVPMMAGTIILATKIMRIVAGEDFAISGKPLQILAIAVFGVYLGAVFGHTAVAINKQKQTMWIYISDAVITLVGYLVFIPLYGMYGAAWMTVFSELYAGLLLFIVVKHYSQERLEYKTFKKIVLSSIIMSAILVLFYQLNILILVLMSFTTYGLSMLALKGISTETLKDIISIDK